MISGVLLLIAFLCACLAAVLGFGWFGTTASVLDVLGVVALALAFSIAANLIAYVPRRGE